MVASKLLLPTKIWSPSISSSTRSPMTYPKMDDLPPFQIQHQNHLKTSRIEQPSSHHHNSKQTLLYCCCTRSLSLIICTAGGTALGHCWLYDDPPPGPVTSTLLFWGVSLLVSSDCLDMCCSSFFSQIKKLNCNKMTMQGTKQMKTKVK